MPYNEYNRELKERLNELRISYRDLAEACGVTNSFMNRLLLVPLSDDFRKIVEQGIERVLANPDRKLSQTSNSYPTQNIELRKRLKALDISHEDIADVYFVNRTYISKLLREDPMKPKHLEMFENAIAQILKDRKNNSQGR